MSKQLDDLWIKAEASDIEACILWVADDGTKAAVELAEKAVIELAAKDAALEAARVIITKLVGYGMMADKYITLGDTDALVAALDAIQKAKP
jgi:hypothetical protein